MKGIPKNNAESKIYSEGRTYDGKLYTFKENDHRNAWKQLDIVVKHLKENWKNLPSDREKIDQMLGSKGGKILNSNGFEIKPDELAEEMMI